MKNKLRNFSVIVLTFIYCQAISMVVTSRINSNTQQHSSIKKSGYSSVVSVPIYFFNTASTESSLSILNNEIPPSFKNETHKTHWAATSKSSHMAKTQFIQYKNSSIRFLIQDRKSNNLFPFHSFG